MLGKILKWIMGSYEPTKTEKILSDKDAVEIIEEFYLNYKIRTRKITIADINLENQVSVLKSSIVKYENNNANNNPKKKSKRKKKNI